MTAAALALFIFLLARCWIFTPLTVLSEQFCLQILHYFFGELERQIVFPRWTCTRIFSSLTQGQSSMRVHQLWLLLPVIVLCVGEYEELLCERALICDMVALFFTASCIYFLSTECRGKRLLLLTSCTSCQKAYRLSPFLLSMPSVIHLLILYQLGWHLPQSSWTFSPSYCPHDVSARVSMQHKTRFKHIFPRPAPYYRCLANDFSLREG